MEAQQPDNSASPEPRPPLAEVLPPMRYHRAVLDYLKTEEKRLWEWFSSEKFKDEYAESVRLDLLKTTYRLERGAHGALYEAADRARGALGLSMPLTLYQMQTPLGMNASLAYIPGEGHLVFSGPVSGTLTPDELVSVVGHELSHYVLWEAEDGQFLVADQLLTAMANHERAHPSHEQTVRLFRLYTEVFADRGSLFVSRNPQVSISGLLKIVTGLAEVSAESYLRQAEEILKKGPVRADETTHPESYIRARALKLWSDLGADAEPEIARMIEGPPGLDLLDLVGQRRMEGLTRRFLQVLLSPPWIRSSAVLAHARLFFEDFAIPPGDAPDDEVFRELETSDERLKDYLCYVLLDFASADPELEEAPLAAGFAVADRLGLADRLQELAARELSLTKKQAVKVRKDHVRILAEAGRNGGGGK